MVDTDRHRAVGRASPGGPSGTKAVNGEKQSEGDLQQEMEALTTVSGEERGSAGEELFEVVFPGGKGEGPSLNELRTASVRLRETLASEALDVEQIQRLRLPAVAAGEVVGRRREPGDKDAAQVSAGEGIEVSAGGECRALRCGYLALIDDRLSVLSSVWVDPTRMQAHWLLLDEGSQPLTREMVLLRLADEGVVEGIEGKAIEEMVARVKRGAHDCGAVPVAAGTFPENGEDAQVEILVDTSRSVGKEREDGSIDFRKVNFATTVQAGQLVARRIPPTSGIPGRDVRRGALETVDGQNHLLKPGKNVEVRCEDGVEQFFSTIAGAFRENGDEIAVTRLLHIQGGVDFKTGNLDFDGEIYVEGSVIQGFSAKATGDITITDTVESGATVTAGGNLTVGRGIVGRKSRVAAEGNVRTQFIQEATVAAGRDILVGSYAYQARLRAGRRVIISRERAREGAAWGGGRPGRKASSRRASWVRRATRRRR